MSSMKYLYKSNLKGLALTNGKSFKKGDTIPVQVYELYISSRGQIGTNMQTVYYFGNEPTMEDVENVMLMPSTQQLILDKDFSISQETSTGTSETTSGSDGTLGELTNNKTVMWLGLIVVGYFAYKYYYKK